MTRERKDTATKKPAKKRERKLRSPTERHPSWEFEPGDPAATEPDWTSKCEVCNASPVMPVTGLCGPCTFGEVETAGGNW